MGTRQTIENSVRVLIPRAVRPRLRALYQSAVDRLEIVRGERDALTPPKRMWGLVGSAEHHPREVGRSFLRLLVERCGLQPREVVLDVGCGIGRIGATLAEYLRPPGRYEGFDIMPQAIEWCQKAITPRHPHCRFTLADVYNATYNPRGKFKASEYRFPYEDESFDLIFLTSVFTHMLPRDVEHYVAEIARVLKPGGRFAISFYLLNERSREGIRAGTSSHTFGTDCGGCYAEIAESPEAALAYDESRVREMFGACGLSIAEPILYGSWPSTKEHGQDILIGTKSA